MKNFIISGFLSVSVLMLLNSCEYQPKDDYYREVIVRDSANISVDLDSTGPTFNLTDRTKFSFNAQTDNLKLLTVRIYVDNKEKMNYSTTSGIFELDNMFYSNGEHKLDIVVTTHSGTGSLADLLNAEGFIFNRSWKFYVDNADPDPVNITKIFNDNGLLKIEWNRYSRINFKKYEVLKILENGSTHSLGVINNADKNFFYDYSYVGDTISYKIRVFSQLGRIADGTVKTFTDEIPVISARSLTGSKVELSWTKCKYDKAFKNYRVGPANSPWQIITNVNTTSIVGDFGILGKTVKFWLETSGIVSAYNDDKSNVDFAIGDPFMRFHKFYKNQVNEDVLVTFFSELYRYNTVSKQILQTGEQYTEFEEYLYSPLDDVLLRKGSKQKLDPATLEVIQTISYMTFATDNLSNSAYGIVVSPTAKSVFDFKNMVVVNNLNLVNGYYSRISGDSKHILQFDYTNKHLECYDIENGQSILKWSIPAKSYLLIPGNASQVVIFTNPEVEIRNIETYELISSFSTTSTEMLDIDQQNKLVMCRNYSNGRQNIELYNYQTGQKINSFIAEGDVSIKDGIIYSSVGRSIAVF